MNPSTERPSRIRAAMQFELESILITIAPVLDPPRRSTTS